MSIVGKAGEYGHNNPDFAFVDSNFIRGGGRIVANLTALYALAANADQLKQNVSIVHVTDIGDGTSRKYELVDITDITAGVFNPAAWKQLQALDATDTPSFAGINITGPSGTTLVKTVGGGAGSALSVESYCNAGQAGVNVLNMAAINNTDGSTKYIALRTTSLNTGAGNEFDYIDLPAGGVLATTTDVSLAVAAGNHYRGKYATLSALTTAIPRGNDGDYAIVAGSASDQEYIWDGDHSEWALTTVVPAGTFAALGGAPSDNAALAAALSVKVDTVSGYGLISSSDQSKLNGITSGATTNSAAAQSDVTTGTDNVKYLTSALWTWIKTQVQTISGIWNFSNGLQSGGNNVETQNNKDTSGGYAGLTLFKMNFKNVLNTFTSYFTNHNTASRTYTFKDRNGTILDDTDAATFVDLSSNQSAIAGDKTFTGVITISAASPTLKFITAGDGGISFVNRTPTLNTITLNNNINSVGGFGNALFQTANTMGITRSDAGMPTGSSITLTCIQWVKFTTSLVSSGCIMSYGSGSSGLEISVWNDGGVVITNGSIVVFSFSTGVNLRDGNWHHVAVKINGAVCNAVIDSISYTIPSTNSYNVALDGTLKTNGLSGIKAVVGYVDQLLIYNSFVATSDIQAMYNGGTGTISVLQTGLIARYEFEGSLTDTNPSVAPVTATFLGSTTYAGIGNGKVPLAGSLQTNQQFVAYQDGINAGEYGQVFLGNVLSGTFLQGNSIYHLINNFYPFIQGNDGSVLISKTNNIQTARGLSALSVVDGVAIGSYATMNAAPSNGLIVSGSVGIGTSSVLSKLNIAGGLSVGSTYAGTNAAPADGLLVQGKTGIGVTTTNSMFEVGGVATSVSGIGRAIYYSGILTASADSDSLYAADFTQGSINVNTGATSINTLTITSAGSGYVNGTYTAVPLTGGAGTGAIATITVAGGAVTVANVINPTLSVNTSVGYAIGNTLSASNSNLGGSGSGLVLTVASVTYRGVIKYDVRANNIVPSVSNGGNIGSSLLPYNQIFSSGVNTAGIRMTTSTFSLADQGAITCYTIFTGTGNMILNRSITQIETNYKLTVNTGTLGSILTTGTIIAASNIGRGVYLNNTLNPTANNDVLVGLDISTTFGTNTTAIQTLGTITGGTGYTNQTAQLRALTGGSGTGATANITVIGGVVTALTLVSQGTGYTTSDVLSCTTIGSGLGFSIPVTAVGLTGVTPLSLRTSGDIQLGGKLAIPTGSNKSAGSATLISGTITISNTLVTSNSIIMLSYRNPSGTTGTHLAQGTLVGGTSFVINSLDTSSAIVTADNNTFNWWLIN